MGSKKVLAQKARREARKMFVDHREALRKHLGKFNEILKPKPKWCPKWLWAVGANIYFDKEKAKEYIK